MKKTINNNYGYGGTGYIICIAVLIIAIIIVSTLNRRGGAESYRYEGKENIQISHTVKSEVAKITSMETYTKNGEVYYELTTSVSGTKLFTFSQEEYNKAFGEGNTAVDCEIYTLEMRAEVIKYRPIWLPITKIDKIDGTEMIKYKDNPYKFEQAYITLYCSPFTIPEEITEPYYYLKIYDKSLDFEEDYLTIELEKNRYSFLGETDFTEEEIAEYKSNVDELSQYALEAFLYYNKK